MIGLILLVAAFLLSLIAAWWSYPPPAPPWRPHFGWLALACYFLSLLLGQHWAH